MGDRQSVRWTRRSVLRAVGAGAALAGTSGLVACQPGARPPERDPSPLPDNPLGVARDAAVDVVLFDGGQGVAYADALAEVYAAARGSGARLTATTTIGTTIGPRMDRGDPPDLLDNSGADALPVAELISRGQLADLRPLLDAPSVDDPRRSVRDSLRPGVVAGGTFGDVVAQVGYAFGFWGIWSSATLFDRSRWSMGRTFDQFRALSEQIADETDLAPYVHPGRAAEYQAAIILGQAAKHGGGDVLRTVDHLEADAWTNDSMFTAARAWERYVADGLVLRGADEMEPRDAQRALVTGRAAMLPWGTWLAKAVGAEMPDDVALQVHPTPSLTTRDVLPYAAVHGGASEGFVVPRAAGNVAGGMEFLRQMLSREGARRFTASTGALTSVIGADPDPEDLSGALASVVPVLAAAGEDVFEFRYGRWYPTLRDQVRAMTARLMAGSATADEFCAVLQQTSDQVLTDPAITKYRRG